MPKDLYKGEYVRFTALDSKGADFMGADNLVGDCYEIEICDENGNYRAYLVNRFGKRVGYLDNRIIRPVQLAQAKDWFAHAFLSFVAFTAAKDEETPAQYWGQVAVLLYDSSIAASMETFEKKLSRKMADGARPQVDFGASALDQLLKDPNGWFPTNKAHKPKMEKGSSIVKDHQTPNERLVEQARTKNKGCYVVSWAFIIAVVATVLFGMRSCGLI